MRLIDAAALLAEAMAEGAYGYVDAKQIADAPTVDAVPVVRCIDCKWHDGIRCFRWNSVIVTGFDDFCSEGERKDNAAD